MKKKIAICVVMAISLGAGIACGNKKISNDVISIEKYMGLEVKETDDPEETARQVWEALLTECTVEEYPTDELSERVEELLIEYGYVAYYKGMTAAELIEEKTGMTAEELAKEQLKKEYAMELIAEKEKLTLTSEEYEKRLEEEVQDNMGVEEYESMFGKEELEQKFQEEKILDFLIENLK